MKTAWILLAAVGMALASNPALGQVIRLKDQVVVDFHQDVRLGDVASVTDAQSGQAQALADTVVVAEIDKPLTLKPEALLMALMTQRHSAALNSLQIGGAASCRITVGMDRPSGPTVSGTANRTTNITPPAPLPPVLPAAATSSAAPSHPSPLTGATPSGQATSAAPAGEGRNTLRDVILARLAQDGGVPLSELQVDIDSTSPLVEQPIAPGQRWLVRPLSRTLLGSVPFETQLVEGTKVLQRLNLSAEVQRHQQVLVTTTKLSRGAILTADNVRLTDALLDRRIPTLFASEKDALGLEAVRDVDAGSRLDERDFKPLLMAHKGDVISIVYLSGALQIQLRGRAQADAKFHDLIEVRNDSTGETYNAVMIKKNLGVVGTPTTEQENALREAP